MVSRIRAFVLMVRATSRWRWVWKISGNDNDRRETEVIGEEPIPAQPRPPKIQKIDLQSTLNLKRTIHSQLNWAVLLCEVIPDGKTE